MNEVFETYICQACGKEYELNLGTFGCCNVIARREKVKIRIDEGKRSVSTKCPPSLNSPFPKMGFQGVGT